MLIDRTLVENAVPFHSFSSFKPFLFSSCLVHLYKWCFDVKLLEERRAFFKQDFRTLFLFKQDSSKKERNYLMCLVLQYCWDE